MASKKLEKVKKINPDRWMTIENLKQPVFYDIPKEYVVDMGEIFNVRKVVDELKNSKEREKYLRTIANQAGERLFVLEKKYRDRTGEVIDLIAQKTGIYFPHVLQRYIEYFYIGIHPEDKYNVTVSTIRELKINFPSCSFKRLMMENNMGDKICSEFCRGVFEKIIRTLDLHLRFSIKQETGTDYCEHQFFNLYPAEAFAR